MALEIERRFLVRKDIRHLCRDGVRITQGYLPRDGQNTVRVRLAGDKATLTMKTAKKGAGKSLSFPCCPISPASCWSIPAKGG